MGRRRRLWVAGGVLGVAGALIVGIVLSSGSRGGPQAGKPPAPQAADGLRHTSVEVSPSGCGRGWLSPRPGTQVFDLRNTSSSAAEVDLLDPGTGAVYGEVEGLAPGTSRPMRVALGTGAYAFKCLPDDADAVTGPTVRVSGAPAAGGPAAVPVTQHDLIPPALAYQQWIQARTIELAQKTDVLKEAVDSGDLASARAAWLPAHLVYEGMGAAYGTFGDADAAINGTTAGLPGGSADPRFEGFHRVEYGLWHGESAASLRGPADRLAQAVHTLRDGWPQARMDPADLGLRAHEILENTVQLELTGRTDYGSGSNLATARANLDGTRELLGRLRPLLTTRYPELPQLDSWLDRTQHTLDGFDREGGWTPLSGLARADRERLNADVSEAVERLAPVAAICDVRRTA
ncbi:EfeM/EfeO family lipoprotein [Streptomyces sp. H10-C2]|uniref:EfeM/EfeO family lipoprotein n=1 Tax=unclassified Streptomyces TaxID=2593676 RepID=UPI0024BBAB08|nr:MULTISPECIES: EfeM/EfeO family lipoprotein [unclassified Streptomyces]MDJ0343888.1 EfeM/EfeO family lipoprotein [Streptomyces sp. PH10-H1]MDJ0373329.1 EfeM/EfeO family lipoprotein [Streptomyces sp. H10-C2]